jgi:hypothetical protein
MRVCAAMDGEMQVAVPIRAQVQDHCEFGPKGLASGRWLPMSFLAQRFADPALGQLVLAHNALGVDPQWHVHAVPGPLGYLASDLSEPTQCVIVHPRAYMSTRGSMPGWAAVTYHGTNRLRTRQGPRTPERPTDPAR